MHASFSNLKDFKYIFHFISSDFFFLFFVCLSFQIDNVDTTNVLELNPNEPSVDEPSTITSLQSVPMTNTGGISNVDNKPNVDEPSTVMSPQLVSMTKTGGINKRKRKNSSYMTVCAIISSMLIPDLINHLIRLASDILHFSRLPLSAVRMMIYPQVG